MTGKNKRMIDSIIEQRAKDNPMLQGKQYIGHINQTATMLVFK